MQIDQSTVYLVILIFSILIIFILGLFMAYLKLLRNYLDTKEGKDRYIDPKELLLRAHAKSQRILEDATDKANKILSSSEVFKVKNLDSIQKQIEKLHFDNLKVYQDSVSKIQDVSLRMLQNVPEYIKTLITKEILIVKDDLFAEIKKANESAKDLVAQAYRKVDEEVAEYKKYRMEALENTIVSIVQQISRRVLNREINLVEHEKLVMKALEEAKRQNIFSDENNKNGEEAVKS